MTFKITTEIEHRIQSGACDNFGLTVEKVPHPGESGCDL